jgi:OPA family glycerol-3-phosphate transporter-like MFS transporter
MSAVDNPAALGPPVEHPPGFRARRGQNWLFLGLMYGFFYMSRYNLSAIQQALKETFGWSHTQYADVATAGVLVYGCAVFLNGPLADKIGGKRAILIGSAGAALFNLLFGLCSIFVAHAAVVKGTTVVTPTVFRDGMTATTMLSTMMVLWACNHYFQSFGALSIVKINAAWFHVRERGKFAGIFGIMIQSGRWFAFSGAPLILRKLPWYWAFWIPSAILSVMFVVNWFLVASTPKDVGYEFHTADETKEEEQHKATLGFVLRKVFASPAMWTIAFASMCIGMVRNAIDQFWPGYFGTVFHLTTAQSATFAPYNLVAYGTPFAAVAGGLVAGNLSDRVFGARRAPVVFFGFVGMAVTLALLSESLSSPWLGGLLLLVLAFFIQSAHSLVGGAASMDFGGKKAVATAAGLFDGAQYLAGAIMTYTLGRLFDAFKNPKVPGAEFDVWPLAPLPFAVVGALLIARLWYALPGRMVVNPTAEALVQRTRLLGLLQRVQRVTLGTYALVAGAVSVLTLILPQQVARELGGRPLLPGALLYSQLHAGARLGLTVVALTAAWTARPPRALVRAVLIAVTAELVGTLFSAVTGGVPWPELAQLKSGLWLDGAVATALLATTVARANLRALPDAAAATVATPTAPATMAAPATTATAAATATATTTEATMTATATATPAIELFHATNDSDSALARQRVVDRGLVERIRFRNVFFAEVQADLTARGGGRTPAIWDGARLIEGRDAVLAFLDGLD